MCKTWYRPGDYSLRKHANKCYFFKVQQRDKKRKRKENSRRPITALSTNHVNKQVNKTCYQSCDKPCERNHLGEDIHINVVLSGTKSL